MSCVKWFQNVRNFPTIFWPHGWYDTCMNESFSQMLHTGGHANSLGEVPKVIQIVLDDQQRLHELYDCLFDQDAWVRMRAADALEKVCRVHADWLAPYIDKLARDFSGNSQPSIQWHMAQIYAQVSLTGQQKATAILWLKNLLSSKDIDWIVAANAMTTLVQFTKDGSFPKDQMLQLLAVQQQHKSSAVVRRATKFLAELSAK